MCAYYYVYLLLLVLLSYVYIYIYIHIHICMHTVCLYACMRALYKDYTIETPLNTTPHHIEHYNPFQHIQLHLCAFSHISLYVSYACARAC